MEFTLKFQQWANIDELKLSRVGMPRILYAFVGAQLFRHFSDISECQAFTHRA